MTSRYQQKQPAEGRNVYCLDLFCVPTKTKHDRQSIHFCQTWERRSGAHLGASYIRAPRERGLLPLNAPLRQSESTDRLSMAASKEKFHAVKRLELVVAQLMYNIPLRVKGSVARRMLGFLPISGQLLASSSRSFLLNAYNKDPPL